MGDDGIGPFLFNELKNYPELKKFELYELGVFGLDLINYIEEKDKLIIVDAVYSVNNIGELALLEEKDLKNDLNLVSAHDLGIEQTVQLLRMNYPDLKKINLIGIKVRKIKTVNNKLSDDIIKKIPKIKKEILDIILRIV